MTNHILLEVGDDGVALVTLNVAGRAINVFTPEFTSELQAVVDQLASRTDIVGAVITSGKPNGFMAGADLLDFVHVHDRGLAPREAAQLVAPAAAALRALERCGKPVAAAINGLALGGGFELCLACHYRVLVDEPKAVVGLPEVTVGLLPAGGGTQRLPRLIGIAKALPLLLTGRHVAGAQALELGLVDALVPAADVLATARRWVLAHPGWQQPWDRKGFAVPGGAGALAPHATESFGLGMAKIRRDTQDNFPAPAAILASVYEGTLLPVDRGLAVEQAHFGQLLAGPVARNLMRTMFIHKGAARRLARRPEGIAKQPVQRLGVLGAGMMGAGIAQVAAAAGIDVILLDATQVAADAGKARIAAGCARDVKAGRCTQEQVEARLARIRATPDYGDLRGCDFVVEAVFEDRAVKGQAFGHAKEGLGTLPAGFVMATNTSTLPVSGLAANWAQPEEFIGLHFFSPVERMALVEVIKGERTSPHALARALDLVAQLGKLPIVVNDSPGFYTSRIFCAYIDEGMAMLREGVAPALIENAAKQAGFATSPLAVTDEVSLDLQQRVIAQAEADGLAARFLRQHAKPVVEAMLARGRLGRKSGGGFHDFSPGQPKRLWPGLAELFRPAAQQPELTDVKHRLLYIQALESARCVQEGVVPEPADADLGSVLALGYPSWTGGTLSFIDTVGPGHFVAECDRLADQHGERFRPCAWLRERARARSAFYSV
ncbi:MAG TPA: 3-hydroxyacyl-CoA dehydrogenase NAD-binding domain-containing protein [Albitalea sp.]|nr:3-hydroxyacyl-CoA dehydrogenase NAD-binding domain-containing protein [Albitalea sp.]